jgi:hypothetical protein
MEGSGLVCGVVREAKESNLNLQIARMVVILWKIGFVRNRQKDMFLSVTLRHCCSFKFKFLLYPALVGGSWGIVQNADVDTHHS